MKWMIRALLLGWMVVVVHGCIRAPAEARKVNEADWAASDLSSEMATWREQKKASGARWRAVLEELESEPGAPWAGTYYAGDGLGYNLYLSVAPRNGFVYEVCGCTGRYDQNLGRVETSARERLSLRAEMPPMSESTRAVADEYLFVRWGERRYLIKPSELDDFRKAVARGDEPRRRVHGRFLLAMNDHAKPVTGEPQIGGASEMPAGGHAQ